MGEESARGRVPIWGWLLLAAGIAATLVALLNSPQAQRYMRIRKM
jgi:hypothetical protein